jgi:hypothetical protein
MHTPAVHVPSHGMLQPLQCALLVCTLVSQPSTGSALQSPTPGLQVTVHVGLQLPPTTAPPSHASTPACTNPSPQVASTQVDRHAFVSSASPSSHSSAPAGTPSPQTAGPPLLLPLLLSSPVVVSPLVVGTSVVVSAVVPLAEAPPVVVDSPPVVGSPVDVSVSIGAVIVIGATVVGVVELSSELSPVEHPAITTAATSPRNPPIRP